MRWLEANNQKQKDKNMGNWMTVNMLGTCAAAELPALRKACNPGKDWDNFHALCFDGSPSLCGLNDWTGEKISAIGNLAERDYTVASVAKTCEMLVKAAPSLTLKIHCGGDYEDKKCAATITVENGTVRTGEPEVAELMDISPAQIETNMRRAMSRSL